MSLETWRHINTFLAGIVLLQLCLLTAYTSIFFKKIKDNFKPIYFYLLGNVFFEILSKTISEIDAKSVYFQYQDYFYLLFECYFIYKFLYPILSTNKQRKNIFYVAYFIIISYLCYDFTFQENQDSGFFSALISFLNSLLLLIALFELSKKNSNKSFIRNPETIICFMFLMGYCSLMVVYFTLPSVIVYSRIMANQLIIFKHIVAIIFYVFICYALQKKTAHY